MVASTEIVREKRSYAIFGETIIEKWASQIVFTSSHVRALGFPGKVVYETGKRVLESAGERNAITDGRTGTRVSRTPGY